MPCDHPDDFKAYMGVGQEVEAYRSERIAFKKGWLAAIIATAGKLAVIIWNMIVMDEPHKKCQVEMSTEKQRP